MNPNEINAKGSKGKVLVVDDEELNIKLIKAIEIGADDFLTKPINRMELFTRTEELMKAKISGLKDRLNLK